MEPRRAFTEDLIDAADDLGYVLDGVVFDMAMVYSPITNEYRVYRITNDGAFTDPSDSFAGTWDALDYLTAQVVA